MRRIVFGVAVLVCASAFAFAASKPESLIEAWDYLRASPVERLEIDRENHTNKLLIRYGTRSAAFVGLFSYHMLSDMDARWLAKRYFESSISGCGGLRDAKRTATGWEFSTVVGVAPSPGPIIHIANAPVRIWSTDRKGIKPDPDFSSLYSVHDAELYVARTANTSVWNRP